MILVRIFQYSSLFYYETHQADFTELAKLSADEGGDEDEDGDTDPESESD